MIKALFDVRIVGEKETVGTVVVYTDGALVLRRWDTEEFRLYASADEFVSVNPELEYVPSSGEVRPCSTLDVTEVQKAIDKECEELAEFLKEKNLSYGNSALDPIRIFSKATPMEAIRVRIDDKLNRLYSGKKHAGDNDIKDLVGYLILHRVGERFGIR